MIRQIKGPLSLSLSKLPTFQYLCLSQAPSPSYKLFFFSALFLIFKDPFLSPICPEPAPYHELDGEVGWRVRLDTYAGLSSRWLGHLLTGSSQHPQTPHISTAGSSQNPLPMRPSGLTGLSLSQVLASSHWVTLDHFPTWLRSCLTV